MDSIAPKEPPLTPDDARYFWHDEPREKFKLRGWHIFVATCVIILLCSLYVLSCGATLADRCRA